VRIRSTCEQSACGGGILCACATSHLYRRGNKRREAWTHHQKIVQLRHIGLEDKAYRNRVLQLLIAIDN
jgi:hypothetical protein